MRTEEGNCLVIKIDEVLESHQGLHRRKCNQQAYFICEKAETLKTELQQYVPTTGGIFPLSLKSGPAERTGLELTGIETNLAYDPLWTPAGLYGSPLFDMNIGSRIDYDFTNVPLQNQLTITFWLRPDKTSADRFLMASISFEYESSFLWGQITRYSVVLGT